MSQQITLINNLKVMHSELREFALPLVPPKKARHELIAFLNLIKRTDVNNPSMVKTAFDKCKDYLPVLYGYLKLKAVH